MAETDQTADAANPTALIAPLFVPATRPDRFEKAAASGADAIIIDLEDAVAPDAKGAARQSVAAAPRLSAPAFVRINALGTVWFEADVAVLVAAGRKHVCLPKVGDTSVVDRIVGALGQDVLVLAQIETAAGLVNAPAIARHPNVVQLAFGPADFFLDLQAPASAPLTGHALATMAIASRAAGKPLPLDGPSFAIDDPDFVRAEASQAAACGAGGKLCIHPAQVAHVLRSFSPSADEVAWAHRVVAANRAGAASVVDGQMIDAPIVARARQLLERSLAQSVRP